MDKYRGYREENRRVWDEITPVHYENPGYRVAEFLDGDLIINKAILDEVGEVRNKKLLHMMCHFGLDTLTFARLGAEVTGVDFSEKSIRLARSLAEKTQLAATFIESDIYDMHLQLEEEFDIVFSSLGVLVWLNDLDGWAQQIASHLKGGGFFYLFEFHPIIIMFSDDSEDEPYFHEDEPMIYDDAKDYCDTSYRIENRPHEWAWTVGDVITALCDSGLRIEFVHEFPYALDKCVDNTVERDGKWWLPGKEKKIPLSFSVKAVKPE
ncbi:MAG: methyltransferase domain-containing protein [candidate division Zixibacteria bacterium]|nr:methyltransferase domain-containing protein [candidate division Zixibacteria bacterium]